jgi:hypothetical protein
LPHPHSPAVLTESHKENALGKHIHSPNAHLLCLTAAHP